MNEHWLNINQNIEELNLLYLQDYYWYLKSFSFKNKCLLNILSVIPEGKAILDVGCGEGQLFDCIDDYDLRYNYHGIDASSIAIEMANQKKRFHNDNKFGFTADRIENPSFESSLNFHTIVFGNIIEILIKPEYRVPFISLYVTKYKPQQFIIYDLDRLNTREIDLQYNLSSMLEIYIDEKSLPNLMEAKRRRILKRYTI